MLPDEIEDSILGCLAFDPDGQAYEGELPTRDGSVPIVFDEVEGEADLRFRIRRARHMCADAERYLDAAKQYTVVQLLGLKNESWLREGEAPVSADEFRRSLRPSEIVFHSDGEVSFFLEEGQGITGHTIVAIMDASDRFISTDIPA